MPRKWYFVVMVAIAIAISYFDRQTLSVAIAAIQHNIPLSNQQFSYLQTAFLLSYAALYVIGGRRLDKNFLSGLDLPADMRVLLYQNRSDHFSPESLLDPFATGNGADAARSADKFAPLIDAVRQHNQETTGILAWSSDAADEEVFHAIPLRGGGKSKDDSLLAILLVGNSRRSYVELKRRIRASALLVGSGDSYSNALRRISSGEDNPFYGAELATSSRP